MNIRKILKWAFNYFRLFFLKIRFGKRIIIRLKDDEGMQHPPYIAWTAKIMIDSRSKLVLEPAVYVSSYCQIKSLSGSSIYLNSNVYIGDYSRIIARKSITIGNYTLLANNVSIYDHDHIFSNINFHISDQGFNSSKIFIGSDCWLATNVVVLKGTNITDHVVVGANAVINKSIDKMGVYGGIPAKLIKKM